ncbi:helix-turn-helix domain-containing protein [Nocardiopsis composta]|uniref:Transcriptional regulator with XRE-family HTH domain n=1 Tax=Nocardiopsis composta TaxID=157465 RepID=A0A7W8QMY5_9ACTN|nr:helix-turn-helix domain-containing protein [Nocardiopsis composta]MBB5433234.1 transcriptional regulator with XRE-family HTH domain [Nocardiopsis composta]
MDETSAPSVPVHFDEQRFGERIRELRTERGLSLRALAQRLGISASALSQIERGKMRPSVTRLYQIMTELDVPMASVFADENARVREGAAAGAPLGSSPGPHWGHAAPAPTTADGVAVTRRDEAATLELDQGVRYRRLTPENVPGMNYFESVYPPGAYSSRNAEYVRHRGREIGNVVSGVLTVDVGFETYELHPGDSIAYPSTTPHRISNQGTEEAVAIWLNLS